VLVEAAVRNYILQIRGYNSTEAFLRRQRVEMAKDDAGGPSSGTEGGR
jgi:serine kinase of HPr protein (carbohydrate metabolism regulator)